jgi:hypothetical protein
LLLVAPLMALIRLEPEEGRRVLLDWLHQKKNLNAALNVAGCAYIESKDLELISILLSMAANVGRTSLWWIFTALDQIGGPAAYQAIASQLERLDPRDAERFRRRDEEYETTVLLDAVAKSGVMHVQGVRSLLEWWSECDDLDRPKTSTVLSMFTAADSEVFLDGFEMRGLAVDESQPKRISWESLSDSVSSDIQRFAAASCGTFHPDYTFAEFMETPDQNAKLCYRVTFIHAKRLYQGQFVQPRDVGRIKEMINAALMNAGVREQFVEVKTIEPARSFVFAKPELLKQLASRFNIPQDDGGE